MKKKKLAKLKLDRETMGQMEKEPLQEAVGGISTFICTVTQSCCHTSCV